MTDFTKGIIAVVAITVAFVVTIDFLTAVPKDKEYQVILHECKGGKYDK